MTPDHISNVRVISVGATAVAGGITVVLLSIEIYSDGAVLSWRAFDEHHRLLAVPKVRVSDRIGTRYEAMAGPSNTGDSGHASGSFRVEPVPPSQVELLRVAIESMGGEPFSTATVVGPWVFEVAV